MSEPTPAPQTPNLIEPDSGSWWYLLHTKLYRYRALFRKYWWVVLFTTCAGLTYSAWKVANQQVVYVSQALMMVSGKVNLQEGAVFAEETGTFMNTQREMMQDETLRQRAESKVRAMFPDIPITGATLAVAQRPGTSIFNLTATGSDERYPQKFLNAVMEEYIATRREFRSQKTEDVGVSIEDAITRVQGELRKMQDKLIAFQRQNNIGFLEQEGNSAGAYLSKLNTQLAELKREAQLLEMFDLEKKMVRDEGLRLKEGGEEVVLDGDPRNSKASSSDLEFIRLQQQIQLLKSERAVYEKDLLPAHDIMVELNTQISRLEELGEAYRKQSQKELEVRRATIALEIQNLETSIKEWEKKALEVSQRWAEYKSIDVEIESKRAQLESLNKSKGNIEINRNVDQEILSIRQKASQPMAIKPGVSKTISTGVLLGLLAGILFLILMDQMDDRVASFTEFQSHFSQRVLAQIPGASGKSRHDEALKPLVPHDERHTFVEAFRSLRSSIIFMPVQGKTPKTLLITSAVPNEGKSTIAINLAITLALSGAKVLLVDGDMRRGEIHQGLGCHNDRGLGDVLHERMKLNEAVQTTSIQGLSLLSRGNAVSNPGELFLGAPADRLLKEMYDKYDYILFDSSPVMAADDTTSLAPKMDATIIVFRFTNSSARTTRKAIYMLQERQTNVVGIVCNDVSEAMQEYYYYSYPEYYSVREKAESGS